MTTPLHLSQYENIVILTGAGVSVASGLPPYRGQGGVWLTNDVEENATADAIVKDPERVWRFFGIARSQVLAAKANLGHIALANAEKGLSAKQRFTVITQNVDGLHSQAGSSDVIEMHGSLHSSRCTECDYSQAEDLARVARDCPRCPRCEAFLRPSVILFDEAMPARPEWEAKKRLRDCDLFLAVGTSGSVWPVANFVRAAEYAGARTIFVNTQAMDPVNPAFQESILGPAEVLLPQLFKS